MIKTKMINWLINKLKTLFALVLVFMVQYVNFAGNLNRKRTIQKTIASLLLIVFTVSIAPKVYFHNLIANHKDFSECTQLHKTAVLHVQGYNCHFDDLVVSVPFLPQTEPPVLLASLLFEKKLSAFYSISISSFSQHKENRGPPSV